jgi:hypothetical protein
MMELMTVHLKKAVLLITLSLLAVTLLALIGDRTYSYYRITRNCPSDAYGSTKPCPTGWRPRLSSSGCQIGLECPGHPELSF